MSEPDDIDAAIPWAKPTGNNSHYKNDGPPAELVFELRGARIRVKPTGETGVHTGRTRYSAWCETCQREIHPSSTGPRVWIRAHVRETHPA